MMNLLASDEIASAIQARHILTRIVDAIVFRPEETRNHVATVLGQQDFDSAPVVSNGSVIGYVTKEGVRSRDDDPITQSIHLLNSSVLVSSDSSIANLMVWLTQRPFLLVVEGNDVVGLVTPSDVNKQPGRTYFYLLIAGLEMTLAQLIRESFGDQAAVLRLLPAGRQEVVQQRVAEERRSDVAADFIAAMDFTDILKVVRAADGLRSALGFSHQADWRRTIENPTIELRHRTMHAVRPLAQDKGSSLAHLVDVDQRLRGLLHAANGALAQGGSPYSGKPSTGPSGSLLGRDPQPRHEDRL